MQFAVLAISHQWCRVELHDRRCKIRISRNRRTKWPNRQLQALPEMGRRLQRWDPQISLTSVHTGMRTEYAHNSTILFSPFVLAAVVLQWLSLTSYKLVKRRHECFIQDVPGSVSWCGWTVTTRLYTRNTDIVMDGHVLPDFRTI